MPSMFEHKVTPGFLVPGTQRIDTCKGCGYETHCTMEYEGPGRTGDQVGPFCLDVGHCTENQNIWLGWLSKLV